MVAVWLTPSVVLRPVSVSTMAGALGGRVSMVMRVALSLV